MRQIFVKNILFILIINLVVKSVWIFMIDRTVQNRVGHVDYGTYQVLFNLSVIFQMLLDLGLNNYNSKIISQEPDRLKNMFPVMLSARIILSLIYATIVMTAGWSVGFRGLELGMLGGMILIQAGNMLMLYIRSNVAALQRFRLDGMLSVTDRFCMILVCGFLLFYPGTAEQFQIEWFVAAQIACYSVALLLAFLVLKRIASFPLRLSFKFDAILKIARESLPYASLIFLMAIYTRSDMLLLERLGGDRGKEEAGIYASAFRLLDVGNTFGLMFAGVLLPMFGRMIAGKQELAPVIRVAVNIMLPVSMLIAIAAHFYGPELMHMLYPAAGYYDGQVLAWLMSSFPAYCIMYVYSTLLTANGNLKLLNYIALAGVIFNVGANLWIIPQEFALGAAVIAFITQSVLAILFIIFGQKRFSLPYNRNWVMAHISFPIVGLLLAAGVSLLSLPWTVELGIFAVIGGLMIIVFKFVTIDSVRMILKRNDK